MKKYKLEINNKEFNTRIVDYSGNRVIVKVNGHDYEVNVTPEEKSITRVVRTRKDIPNLDVLHKSGKPETVAAGTVTSPIPGLVISLKVSVGDTVQKGDTIIILEAMKMESEIASTASGTVKKIFVKEQQSLQEGDPIIEVG
ncbi:MAG: biotin/lipoyl-binding protein [Candidatus Cloacimonetes bacterium]|nr:biotin/lipoyl-binding protein [Candidatus Cloacimonadota bacterium]